MAGEHIRPVFPAAIAMVLVTREGDVAVQTGHVSRGQGDRAVSDDGASSTWQWVPYVNSYAEVNGKQMASVSGGTLRLENSLLTSSSINATGGVLQLASEHFYWGWSAEELLHQHPDLRPHEVYAALTFDAPHISIAGLDGMAERVSLGEQKQRRQHLDHVIVGMFVVVQEHDRLHSLIRERSHAVGA